MAPVFIPRSSRHDAALSTQARHNWCFNVHGVMLYVSQWLRGKSWMQTAEKHYSQEDLYILEKKDNCPSICMSENSNFSPSPHPQMKYAQSYHQFVIASAFLKSILKSFWLRNVENRTTAAVIRTSVLETINTNLIIPLLSISIAAWIVQHWLEASK